MNTGEFAKRCRTEKRTIFHYEQMGLLTPAAVHENGYREFSESQLEIMDMIKVLQAAGFTLREIKQIIAKPPEQRRADFFASKASLEARIQELRRMERYIEKKQQLWQVYCRSRDSGVPYQYALCRFTYAEKAVDAGNHFFSFLQDGDYDLFCIDESGGVFVMKEVPEGQCREGMAVQFFLEIPSGQSDLLVLIRERLGEFGFLGEQRCYLQTLPHLLLEDGKAVLRATVFGHFEEKTEAR